MSKELIVYKANELIRASYELSLSEQRVILLCIANINSSEDIPKDYQFTITTEAMARELGVSRVNAARDLKTAVNKLYNRTIKIDSRDDSEMRWLYKKAFFESSGVAVIHISPSLFPFLFELKKCFTSYHLKYVAQFKSAYSIRVYELLRQFKKETQLCVDVGWLREALQLGDKYPRTSDIKKKIVLPAIADIQEFSDLNVSYEQVKYGKEIVKFIFKYAPKKTPQTKSNATKPLIPLFTGHPEYPVDSETVLEEHQRLKEKPEANVKKTLDSDKKSKITGLKRAIKHG
jgi:plasmid replication initiation protein